MISNVSATLGLAERLHALVLILQIAPQDLHGNPRGGPIAAMMQQMHADGASREDPSREIFARIGDKWSALLLLLLKVSPFRHAMLLRLAGVVGMDRSISQRMLTLRLRSLERDGLILRTQISERPLQIEYALTPLGEELSDFILDLLDWIRRHAATIKAARLRFEASNRG